MTSKEEKGTTKAENGKSRKPGKGSPEKAMAHAITGIAHRKEVSVRQFYKANAPSVPDWFVHQPPPRGYPDMPTTEEVQDSAYYDLAHAWLLSLDAETTRRIEKVKELRWFVEKVKAHRFGKQRWEYLNQLERVKQWAALWADLMIAEDAAKETAQ